MDIIGQERGVAIPGQSIYEESATPKAKTSARLVLGDRVFRYCLNGGVALAAGKMTQSAAPAANHSNLTVAAAVAAGSRTITATLGATAAAKNLYAGGYVHVNDVTGEGGCYRIKGHEAVLSSGVITLDLYDEVQLALTTSSQVTLTKGSYDSVIIAPNGGLTAPARGVPLLAITASYYFWLQTKGPAPVLTIGTVVIGQKVGLGGTNDGAAGPVAADVTDTWGRVMQVNATTEYSLIDLCLD